jgi:hypothetical protein
MIIPFPQRQPCPHIVIRTRPDKQGSLGFHLVPFPCSEPATVNGWCREHQHGFEIMALGERLGYPGLVINGSLEIYKGIEGWYGYAVHSTPSRAREVLAMIERQRN